jgi:broad specificity phosphatase PhoE
MTNERNMLLVRHPETQANVDGRYVGRGDAPLTALGQEQSSRLVAAISQWEPDEVWSSPLPRALDVAKMASELSGVEPIVDERLTELDFGIAEGLTYEETQRREISFQFKSVDEPVAPGGESRRDIFLRTADVLDDALSSSERIAVVTHGGVFRSGLVHLLGLSIDEIWTFHIRNAQIAEIRLIDERAMLERFIQA